MRNILFVHQSAEMYGSDKVLLSLVAGLDRSKFTPIVLLPCEGPLMVALKEEGVRCHIVPMVRVGRATLSLTGLAKLPWLAWKSVHAISKTLESDRIDLVHSNTLAVLSGAIWSFQKGVPHVWHVHEMIERPMVVRKMYGWLLRAFADRIICNSHATRNLLLQDQPCLALRSRVIWNGINRKQAVDLEKTTAFRTKIGVVSHEVLVVLLGRINRWKGQCLLVDAAAILNSRGEKNIHYAILGSPPVGQEHFLRSLEERVKESGVGSKISLLDFTPSIWEVWDSCDIAVIPSTEPEPFGMVAVEAMAAGKPVIAANHGGLAEIVVHGETGLLCKPNNAEDLATAIEILAKDEYKRSELGKHGARRAKVLFSADAYVTGISKVYKDIC